MKLIGRTSGAEAVVSDNVRLVTDGLGSLYGSFFFRNPGTSKIRFRTGTKTFKLTNVSNDTLPLPGGKRHSELGLHTLQLVLFREPLLQLLK